MEEEKRIGDQYKGWNDPPSFTYDKTSQAQTTPRKNLLNQRVAMPQTYSPSTTGALSNQVHCSPPYSTPPPSGPPLSSGCPPPTGPPPVAAPPMSSGSSLGAGPPRVIKDVPSPGTSHACDDVPSEEVSCEATIVIFRKVFEQCKEKLQKRVISDIERRLKLLNDSWKSNKLSSQTKRKTAKLATELHARKYDSAHEIHLSLMVDHVSEVSLKCANCGVIQKQRLQPSGPCKLENLPP